MTWAMTWAMIRKLLCTGVVAFAAAGCTSVSSNYSGEVAATRPERINVCHGFNCYFKTRYAVSAADRARFQAIMAQGRASPAAERSAISRAVMLFEERASAAIGVRDRAKSGFSESGQKGQMDCIDESTNTRSLLLYLAAHGWLQHHDVLSNVSRGVFLDGRYPHSTAVVREKASGRRWAIDSWYEPAGGAPDIMPLEEWLRRGVMGER